MVKLHDGALEIVRLIQRFFVGVLEPVTQIEVLALQRDAILGYSDLRSTEKVLADSFDDEVNLGGGAHLLWSPWWWRCERRGGFVCRTHRGCRHVWQEGRIRGSASGSRTHTAAVASWSGSARSGR